MAVVIAVVIAVAAIRSSKLSIAEIDIRRYHHHNVIITIIIIIIIIIIICYHYFTFYILHFKLIITLPYYVRSTVR